MPELIHSLHASVVTLRAGAATLEMIMVSNA
jgi:hypothetical protein